MTNHIELAARLTAAIPTLPERDRDFASSLVAGFRRFGRFTDRMLPYAERLANGTGANPVISVDRLFAMMATARAKLKRPTIRVMTDDGCTYAVRPAGETSRNSGSLYIFEGTGEGKTYAGCVSPSGEFRCSREVRNPKAVEAAVRTFAADPAKAAKAYGTLTNACCFCGRRLTDAESVRLGYGPICAESFGLDHAAAGHALHASMTADGTVSVLDALASGAVS